MDGFPEWPDFSRFSRHSRGPTLLLVDPEGSEWSGCNWMLLDVTGCNWKSLDIWQVCLDSSRTFGLRHVLAGQSCRHRVGVAHGGSRIDVVVVRE